MRFTKTHSLLLLLLLFVSQIAAGQSAPPAASQYGQINRKPYLVVFFVKGENWSRERSKEETDRLLAGHLAYLRKQVEAGKYALVGPLTDDDRIRGIIFVNAGSVDEARKIVSSDPMVNSGQFAAEIHPVMMTDLSAIKAVYPPMPRQ